MNAVLGNRNVGTVAAAKRIGKISVEYEFGENPLGETHSKVHYGQVARLIRR